MTDKQRINNLRKQEKMKNEQEKLAEKSKRQQQLKSQKEKLKEQKAIEKAKRKQAKAEQREIAKKEREEARKSKRSKTSYKIPTQTKGVKESVKANFVRQNFDNDDKLTKSYGIDKISQSNFEETDYKENVSFDRKVKFDRSGDKSTQSDKSFQRGRSFQGGERVRSRGMTKAGIVFLVLALVFALLTAALSFTTIYFANNHSFMEANLNATYQKCFYDSVDAMNNLSVNLSKLRVSQDSSNETYLNNTQKASEIIVTNLSSIPVSQEAVTDSLQFANQLGDYCEYLKQKAVNGEEFSQEDTQNIEQMYQTVKVLVQKMNEFYAKVENGYKFTEHLSKDNMENNDVSNMFEDLNGEGAIEYPKLIYDGPFSQSVMQAQWKGLPSNEVSSADATKSLSDILEDMNVEKVNYKSQSTANEMSFYNYEIKLKKGTAHAQMSQKGGKLIMYDYHRDMDNVSLTTDDCLQIAQTFVDKNVQDMTPVWNTESKGVLYINFVYKTEGIICYNDMIKVKVARDNGDILGYEATPYFKSHTQRTFAEDKKSLIECRQKVSPSIKIENERLALVPAPYGSKEVLCYEFYGEYDQMLYFVYIDVASGEEINVLRVIDSEDGNLII